MLPLSPANETTKWIVKDAFFETFCLISFPESRRGEGPRGRHLLRLQEELGTWRRGAATTPPAGNVPFVVVATEDGCGRLVLDRGPPATPEAEAQLQGIEAVRPVPREEVHRLVLLPSGGDDAGGRDLRDHLQPVVVTAQPKARPPTQVQP